MLPADQERFPPRPLRLLGGTRATIRPLREADAEALAAFYATVPPADFRFYCPHVLDRQHAMLKAGRAGSPEEVALVIELADGSLGGYAWYRWEGPLAERSTFGICLRRDCQGLGAGAGLMSRLLAIAAEVGPPVMSLTVQFANARAVALYRHMGFAVVREQVRPAKPEFGLAPEPEYYMERRVR